MKCCFFGHRDATSKVKEVIKSTVMILINEGITGVGNCSFRFLINLKEVIIPVSLTNIYSYAFRTDENITDIYYAGTEEQWNSITIEKENDSILNATKHYNYVECKHNYEAFEMVQTLLGRALSFRRVALARRGVRNLRNFDKKRSCYKDYT